ncbi:THUMP domain-containing class I SAM-dependent RNA methyltransferase [Scatolibacter rhodanostii]|uniref:THUMP domain-containing class I SAM-dependent RNA methyltransferase n=1 Tax=Scatolibacter rhodanostii TaxID=2014781 RepID=UPI000C07D3CC|nr:class I SAM-dependent RNA methyltransferase [Scatolibacter rhodanostii]
MKLTLVCPCLLGIEGLVADELRALQCENVRSENGRVYCDGDMQTVARININARYAERVMILLKNFQALSFEELFQGVKSIPWEQLLLKEDTFPVSGSSVKSQLFSISDCQAIIKKAIVERLKEKYNISWFEETGPLHKVRFWIMKDQVSIMIDTSGNGLHKRGYRKNALEAPIKETLAAAVAKLARVRSDGTIIDPFCGSGTILIEALMLAKNMAPGVKRKFNAEDWLNIPKKIWREERERAESLVLQDAKVQAFGFDIEDEAIELTIANAKKAGVFAHLKAQKRDIRDFKAETDYGCVLANPPYGERLLDREGAAELYRVMGKVFTPKRGWSYSIITPEDQFEKLFTKKADRRRKLYNGMIPCQLYMYYK